MKDYKHKIPDTAELVFKGVIFDVYQWQQTMYDGSVETFEMIKRPDTVIVIAIIDDKIIVLNDEQPHRSPKLSFPGGRADKGDETWLEAAKREVLEETGYSFETWRQVMVIEDQPKIQHAVVYFIAQDVISRGEQQLDVGERIEVRLQDFVSLKQDVLMQKDQYIHYAREIFKRADSIKELKNLQSFDV